MAELDFILKLEDKLHYTTKAKFTPNMSGEPFDVGVDQYTERRMTNLEVRKLLKVWENNDLVLYPINTSMGFAVGFELAHRDGTSLLTFQEKQLPDDYNFKKLSKYFMREDNVEKAKRLGQTIQNNRSHYDY